MKPMDKAYIEQHDIAQRYLKGKLSLDEVEAFEVYLMDHPDAIDELRLDTVFIEHNIAMQPENRIAAMGDTGSRLTEWLRPFFASVATAAVCMLTFMWLPTHDSTTAIDNVVVSPTLIYVSNMRGNRQVADAQFDIDEQKSPAIIVVQDNFEKDKTYNVDMFYGDDDVIAKSTSYKANSDSELLVTLPTAKQKDGMLSIVYYSQSEPEDKRTLTVKINM